MDILLTIVMTDIVTFVNSEKMICPISMSYSVFENHLLYCLSSINSCALISPRDFSLSNDEYIPRSVCVYYSRAGFMITAGVNTADTVFFL